MYTNLKNLLLNKEYNGNRCFVFPRQSGTTAMLLRIADEISKFNGSVAYIVKDNMMENIKDRLCRKSLVNILSISDIKKLETYDYYIFDNSVINPGYFKTSKKYSNNYTSIITK